MFQMHEFELKMKINGCPKIEGFILKQPDITIV